MEQQSHFHSIRLQFLIMSISDTESKPLLKENSNKKSNNAPNNHSSGPPSLKPPGITIFNNAQYPFDSPSSSIQSFSPYGNISPLHRAVSDNASDIENQKSDSGGAKGSYNSFDELDHKASLSDTQVDQSLRQTTRILSKYKKKIRRTAGGAGDRGLLRFKRVKKHKLFEHNNSTIQLYNPDEGDVSVEPANKQYFRLSAYCTADSYNLSAIIEHFENNATFRGALVLYSDVLQIKQRPEHRDLFLFSYGCMVFYNYTEEEELSTIKIINTYAINTIKQYELEDFDYNIGTESRVSNDEITLSSKSSLEKLSIAFALAQCVKLNVYEAKVDEDIEINKYLPATLAQTGEIGLSQEEISRKIGTLFLARNEINLHSDLLDIPEFLWSEDKYRHVYDRLTKYLELNKRVQLLNTRLQIMKELFDMLNAQAENVHATKLEWIIIWLIVFEVIIGVLSLWQGYHNSNTPNHGDL
jgi:uncharacterized Rmd1/YagE family protein